MTKLSGMWSIRTLTRYWLLQLPAILFLAMLLVWAQQAHILHTRLALIILFVWVLKDAALYPFLWKAYDPSAQDVRNQLVGLIGEARESLDPVGYIKVNGELWQAEISDARSRIRKGDRVRVFGVNGLTLQVQPLDKNRG